MNRALIGLGFGLGCLSAACALEQAPGEEASVPGAVAESASSTSDALTSGWALGPNRSRPPTGTAPVGRQKLYPVATHLCMLTRIQGRFVPERRTARLTEQGGSWYLETSAGIDAQAYCFERSAFAGEPLHVTDLSPEVQATDHTSVDTLPAYAFTFLTGIEGNLSAYDTKAEATAPTIASGFGSIVSSPVARPLNVFGRAFSVGAPSERLARYYTSADQVSSDTTPFSLPPPSGTSAQPVPVVSIKMARVRDAVCGFTSIRGASLWSSFYVSIDPVPDGKKPDRWQLSTNNTTLSASARCFARIQTP